MPVDAVSVGVYMDTRLRNCQLRFAAGSLVSPHVVLRMNGRAVAVGAVAVGGVNAKHTLAGPGLLVRARRRSISRRLWTHGCVTAS